MIINGILKSKRNTWNFRFSWISMIGVAHTNIKAIPWPSISHFIWFNLQKETKMIVILLCWMLLQTRWIFFYICNPRGTRTLGLFRSMPGCHTRVLEFVPPPSSLVRMPHHAHHFSSLFCFVIHDGDTDNRIISRITYKWSVTWPHNCIAQHVVTHHLTYYTHVDGSLMVTLSN